MIWLFYAIRELLAISKKKPGIRDQGSRVQGYGGFVFFD
jgi:hypothetical protein